MFHWLDTSWKFVRGIPSNTSKLVHRIFHAIIGWATNIFGIIGNAWDDLAGIFHSWASAVRGFMGDVFNHIAKIVTHTIPDLARILWNGIAKVAADLAHFYSVAAGWVAGAIARAEGLVRDALRWVRDNVYNPLAHDIGSALSWIENTGKQLWHLLHDGEYIAALVLRWIWSQLLALIRHYFATLWRAAVGTGLGLTLNIARMIEEALAEVL